MTWNEMILVVCTLITHVDQKICVEQQTQVLTSSKQHLYWDCTQWPPLLHLIVFLVKLFAGIPFNRHVILLGLAKISAQLLTALVSVGTKLKWLPTYNVSLISDFSQ